MAIDFEQKIVTQAKQFKISEDTLAKPLKQLSGGEQTRIAIIRAILSTTNIVITRRTDKPFRQ
jgi:ATP-binding cassette subfamily F protein 3